MIADAILYAAEHPGREMVVAGSALQAIFGQKVAPGLIDLYLARTGYESQQREEAEQPGRPDNLFEALPGDRGADGPFSGQSRRSSIQLWLRERPALAITSSLALAAAGIGALARRRPADVDRDRHETDQL